MQKWTFFSMGVMAGLILLLGGALLAQGREPVAHAMQGVDNQGKYALAIGGSAQGLTDMLWVLHEHPPLIKDRTVEGEGKPIQKPSRISLCLYKLTRNGDQMKLCAVRDIAYDVEIPDFNSEPPKVREVVDMLRKNMPKEKD